MISCKLRTLQLAYNQTYICCFLVKLSALLVNFRCIPFNNTPEYTYKPY